MAIVSTTSGTAMVTSRRFMSGRPFQASFGPRNTRSMVQSMYPALKIIATHSYYYHSHGLEARMVGRVRGTVMLKFVRGLRRNGAVKEDEKSETGGIGRPSECAGREGGPGVKEKPIAADLQQNGCQDAD